jgi:DNA-binding NtrC family response regulator
MTAKPLVLVVDDERHAREGLARALRREYRIVLAQDGASALEAVAAERPDIILSDLRMPGMGGMELLRRIRGMEKPPVFILLTAYGSIETAVEAMRRGAFDFLPKPVDLDRLEALLARAAATLPKPAAPAEPPPPAGADGDAIPGLIGRSEPMKHLASALRKAAQSRATVLLQGESGTGKEVAARAIHALSARASGPFVAVHCASLTPSLLESELFGHEKGAYTDATARTAGRFERADGGTLFLDEIGEIDAATQVKILRVLEERAFERVGGTETVHVDVRLIAATNRDLAQAVAEGRFREDLFYRLYVVNLSLPPLRERTEDLPELCRHFLALAAEENGVPAKTLAPETEKALSSYPWPGNVREVRNLMERLTVLSEHDPVPPEDLPAPYRGQSAPVPPSPAAAGRDVKQNRTESAGKAVLSREALEAALAASGGNRTRAAAALGVSRRTVIRAIERYRT